MNPGGTSSPAPASTALVSPSLAASVLTPPIVGVPIVGSLHSIFRFITEERRSVSEEPLPKSRYRLSHTARQSTPYATLPTRRGDPDTPAIITSPAHEKSPACDSQTGLRCKAYGSEKLALRELRALASLLQTVLLALHDASVASEEAGLLQLGAIVACLE